MKNLIYVFFAAFISACASGPTPFEEANLHPNFIYKFSNQTSNHNLYLMFLTPTEDSQELLFKTVLKSESIGSFRVGDPGVYHQKKYEVNARGKLRFLVIEPGLYEEVLAKHQYSHYGIQREDVAVFKYQLDMRRAFIEQ